MASYKCHQPSSTNCEIGLGGPIPSSRSPKKPPTVSIKEPARVQKPLVPSPDTKNGWDMLRLSGGNRPSKCFFDPQVLVFAFVSTLNHMFSQYRDTVNIFFSGMLPAILLFQCHFSCCWLFKSGFRLLFRSSHLWGTLWRTSHQTYTCLICPVSEVDTIIWLTALALHLLITQVFARTRPKCRLQPGEGYAKVERLARKAGMAVGTVKNQRRKNKNRSGQNYMH